MSDLLWQLLRSNNRFQIKRNGITLSTEKGNLKGVNSLKYSGLAQSKAVDIAPASATFGILFSKKRTKKELIGNPSKQFHTVTVKRSFPGAARAISKELAGYRPDLTKVALTRLSKIMAVQKAKRLGKKKRVKTGRYTRTKKAPKQ
eukprot:jgi/Galph1/4325/GphlegSOOS_G2947.1